MYSDNLIPELPNTGHSCSRDAVAMLVSHWYSQVMLYPFQKYLCCWEHEYVVSHNKITSVEVTFCMLFYNLFLLKSFDTPLCSSAHKKLHRRASFMTMFLKRTGNG
jgi:hypothetical protein